MNAKFLALAALIVLPMTAHADWASSKPNPGALEDLHIFQMCNSSDARVCYDMQHIDENSKHIQGDLDQIRIREHQLRFSAPDRDSRALFKMLLNEDTQVLREDRARLKLVFKASMGSETKHQIAELIKQIDNTIASHDEVASTRYMGPKAVK